MTSNLDPLPLKKRFLPSIQGKLVLLLFILVIPNLFILTYMYYDRFQSRRVEELQANLELARAVSKNFEAFCRDIVIDEVLIGTALTSSQPLSNQDQNRILAKARTMRSTVWRLFWVNPAGRILAATDPESIGIEVTERSYFREMQAGRDIVVSDLIPAKKTGRPTFTISRAIRNDGGGLVGIVIAEIAPDELEGVLGIQRSLDASVAILDSKGMLVYRYPAVNCTWEQRNWLAQVPLVEDTLKSKEVVARVTAVSTGKPQLSAFAPIPSIGWVSAASRAEDVVMRAVRFKLLPQAALRLLVTVIAFGIALVYSRKISASIGKLRDHVLALGRGESQTPAAMAGTVELDDLANAFNKMTEDLQSRQWEQKQAEQALRENEARLRQIIDLVPHMIFVNDWDGKYLLVNKAVAEACNTSVGALTGKYYADFHPDEGELQNMLRDDREVITKGQTRFIPEAPYTDARGNLRFLQTTKVPFHIFGDKMPAVLGVAIDITESKRAEEVLRESEEQFRTLVESAPDAIFIQVGESFAYVNDAAVQLYGAASEQDLLGCDLVERIHPDHRKKVLERLRSISEEGKPAPLMEQKHLKLDGTTIYVEAHSAPFRYLKSEGALVFVRDITERKQTEESLLLSEDRYRRLFEDAMLGIFRSTPDGKLINVNPAYARMFGFDSPEEAKLKVNDVGVDLYADPSRRDEIVRMIFQTEEPIRAENLYRRKGGNVFTGNLHAWAVRDREGKLLYIEGFIEDITELKRGEEERKKLQEQLFQAQKMESVGRLAGGVAHDFNNMLGVIIGRAEMALEQDVSNDKLQDDLDEILKAGLRSADLTRQLLAFARKQNAVPKTLDLNDTISGMLKMLRRLIGEDVDLLWVPGLDLRKVRIDPSQVDQILANLVVNARDAISGVGAITLRTENIVIDDTDRAEHLEFIPGDYVLLTVSDTGEGMGKEVREKIFEPFFTTKELGKGTGLGLSTVYGIVKQNDGFIYVASKPGEGTTFKIYLPRFEAETAQVPSEEVADKRPAGAETILLVEDDEAILNLSKIILEKLGYTVLAALTPVNAMHLAREHPGDLHLVITDVVMPEMHGRELAEQLSAIRPNLKCLYMSGYTADVIAHRGILDEGLNFIQKPFGSDDFAAKVRQVLDNLE